MVCLSCAAWDGRVLNRIQMHGLGRPCVVYSKLCSLGQLHGARLSCAAWDGRVLCESDLRGLGRPCVESNPDARPGTAVRFYSKLCSLGRPHDVRLSRAAWDGSVLCESCAAWDGRVLSRIQMHGLGRPCFVYSKLCSLGRPHGTRLSDAAWDGRVNANSSCTAWDGCALSAGSCAAWDSRMAFA